MSEERIMWQGSPSYRAFVFPLILCMVLLAIPIIGWIIDFYLLAGILWTLIQFKVASFKITSTSAVLTNGLGRQERKIAMESIGQVTVRKPILQRIVGCSNLEIVPDSGKGDEGNGSRIVFKWVTKCEEPKSIIEQLELAIKRYPSKCKTERETISSFDLPLANNTQRPRTI
jgi:uncharacterized membrane protein YdbT with pleckstrin-like domain